MKQLKWPINKQDSDYLSVRKAQNIQRAKNNPNENWMRDILKGTNYKWTRQALWGYRIFDFWCAVLGVAVEVDGPEHNPTTDSYRDEYNFRRSGVVVLRVRNHNDADAHKVVVLISRLGSWAERRQELGITAHTKRERRQHADKPYDGPSMLTAYLERLGA